MIRRNRHGSLIPRLLLVAALLLGLSPLLQTASAQDGADGIAGDYAVSIPKDAAPKDLPNSPMLVGSWHLQFAPDGTYVAERIDLGPLVTGTYEIDGETLTITDLEGSLSCSQAGTTGDGTLDFATGVYTFEQTDDGGLRLETEDDGCRIREVLLASFELSPFVACPVPPAGLESAAGATPVAEAPDAETLDADVEDQIDRFLAQLTSCWLTGDANRFLPLLTSDYQSEFLSGGIEDDPNPSQQARALASAMGTPLLFERAGDIRETRDNEVTCIVRTELAGQESFARFRFVQQEDGSWLWDGPA